MGVMNLFYSSMYKCLGRAVLAALVWFSFFYSENMEIKSEKEKNMCLVFNIGYTFVGWLANNVLTHHLVVLLVTLTTNVHW